MKHRLKSLQAAATAARGTPAYHAEGASSRFTEDLLDRMETLGLTRVAVAERIGSIPAHIDKILRGDTNFTFDTMVKIARALDCELEIALQPSPEKRGTKPKSTGKAKAIRKPKPRPFMARNASERP